MTILRYGNFLIFEIFFKFVWWSYILWKGYYIFWFIDKKKNFVEALFLSIKNP